MNLLLIAPDSFEFRYNDINYIDNVHTSSKSIKQVLAELKDKKPDVLIIPAEQTINSCNNISFSGIELIKHIRLTPELSNINKLPIILLHWNSIDYYINSDLENIFLYSPSIYKHRLPYCKIDFDNLNDLSENLTPFLFGSENDETKNDHVFRNEIAIEQFTKLLNNPKIRISDEELWYKKIYYRNFHHKTNISRTLPKNNNNINLTILVIDDYAYKWKIALEEIFKNCKIKVEKNYEIILEKIILNGNIDISELQKVSNLGKDKKESFVMQNLNSKYDLILLDMYFSDTEKEIENSSGFKFLKQIEENNINIPVMIFSASVQDLSYLFKQFNFILGRFIKGFSPLNEFIEKVESIEVTSKLCKLTSNIRKLDNIMKINTIIFYKKLIDEYGKVKISQLTVEEVFGIRLYLQSILDKCNLIINSHSRTSDQDINNQQLLELLGLFGIIQEFRLDKNCCNFKLSDSEKKLKEYRNLALHSNNSLSSNTQNTMREWKELDFKSKINQIENAMLKTVQGLLFGL